VDQVHRPKAQREQRKTPPPRLAAGARGPQPTVPLSGTLQIALLGEYLGIRDRLAQARKAYRRRVRDWTAARRRDPLALDSVLLDLLERRRLVSLTALKAAVFPRRPQLARGAMIELLARYGWGRRRTSGATSAPAGTINAQLRRARQTIRETRLDPFLVARARGDPATECVIAEQVDRIARETFATFAKALARYSQGHRHRPPV
jgi:hypothetical protein